MRVLVCGGRDFDDVALVETTLNRINAETPITTIIEGGALGADRLGYLWAKRVGTPTIRFSADWATHGRAAGPIRNSLMLKEGKPDLVVAFPGGRGTGDMASKAEKAGIDVLRCL